MDKNRMGHHISEQFNHELEDIRNNVLIMGGFVEQQIEQAVEAFKKGDIELAELVIKHDSQVDALEMAIDKECAQILAQRQPEAFDLRLLITVMKIIHEIESIGDKATYVAKLTINSSNVKSPLPHYELENLAKLVIKMLHDALDAFARITLENVSAIIEQDDTVNREYDSILRLLIVRMMENSRNISWALDVLWAVRALERIGDHSCYICEHLIFMIKGEDVRHLSHSELKKAV